MNKILIVVVFALAYVGNVISEPARFKNAGNDKKKTNFKKPKFQMPKFDREKLNKFKDFKFKKNPGSDADMINNIRFFKSCYENTCLKSDVNTQNPCRLNAMADIRKACPPPARPSLKEPGAHLKFQQEVKETVESCMKDMITVSEECKDCITRCHAGPDDTMRLN